MKSGKTKQNGKEELRKDQKSKKYSKTKQKLKINTPPNTLNASSSPLIVIYHVSSLNHSVSKQFNHASSYPLIVIYYISSLNHPVRKEFNQLCAHTLPLWQ
jgi:hypothetical protein